ncbi:MAG: hypothetical protein ACK55Z_20320, partial [bacterium]
MGKHHQVRQRKQPGLAGELIGREGEWFVGHRGMLVAGPRSARGSQVSRAAAAGVEDRGESREGVRDRVRSRGSPPCSPPRPRGRCRTWRGTRSHRGPDDGGHTAPD